ncbi:MAG: class I SAM-dependent methyltransferase [Acidobacteriota bacterium]
MTDILYVDPDTPAPGLAADLGSHAGLHRAALALAGSRWLAGQATRPLCSDPWAGDLAGDEGRDLALELRGQSQAEEQVVALRTAYFDRQVETYIRGGVRQVVLLGAGLDTRAARLAAPGVRVFEVDRPASLSEKASRLEALEGYPPAAAAAVPCDLTSDDLLAALERHGFNAFEPALFLMENVACYLNDPSLRRLLTALRQTDPRSLLLFDHMDPRLRFAETMRRRARILREAEPVRWYCEDPLPLFAAAGFRHVSTSRLDVFCLLRTGNLGRSWGTHLYGLAQVSAGAPLGGADPGEQMD